MKTLVLYYSSTGNTQFIAETVANTLGANIEEIKPQERISTTGISYVVMGIRQLLSQPEPKIEPLKSNVSDYDLVVVGTPVWSYSLSSPIRTLLNTCDFKGKSVAFFCTHGGDKGKTFENMAQLCGECNIVSQEEFYAPLKNKPQSKAEAESWAKTLH